MRHHRRWIMTAALTMLLTTGGWLVMQAARSDRIPDLVRVSNWQPETWYRLDSRGPAAACELPAGHRYRLVLGCLGDATQEHAVSFRLTTSKHSPNAVSLGRHANDLLRIGRVGPAALRRAGPPENQVIQDGGPALEANLSHPTRGFQPAANRWTNPSAALSLSSTPRTGADRPLVTPREFFLHVTDGNLDDPKQYARITADNVASGSRVRVFVDQQLARGEVPQSRIDELVRMLDDDVVPRVESQFGPLSDIDGDGCLAVVLTPWLSRLQGGRTSIGGMVRSSDYQRSVSPPFGNRSDMLFLNSSLPSDAALRDLLSHEVAHAACISQRLSRGSGRLRDEEDWLSESLAHLAEPGWSNLDHRLAAFLDDPSRYPLVVPDYYRAGLWRNPGCRGATFLFTRWCVEQSEPQLVRKLAQSEECGTHNLERATGRRFDELFREWSLSLASGDQLKSLDLQNVLRRVGSSGLQPNVCHAENCEDSRNVRGTAFTVIDLLVDESSSRTLHIAGDSAAKWQFSICRLQENSQERTQDSTLAATKP